VRSIKLQGNHAGYAAWEPEETLPVLKHVGEEWAFPDYAVPDHSHDCHEFHLQLSGQTEWQIKTETCVVGKSSLIGISPKVRHSMSASGSHANHFIYCSIDIDALSRKLKLPLIEALLNKPHFLIADAEAFTGPFQILSREMRRKDKHRKAIIKNAMETVALLLDRYSSTEDRSLQEQCMDDLIVTKAKEYCEHHLTEKLCVQQMADRIGVSKSHLFSILKEKLGVSPFAYHAERRMERAREMLRTDYLPLTTIALELGFASSQHFSTAFKKRFGISPSSCRKKL
jgi:AraC-like DNA-binding protein